MKKIYFLFFILIFISSGFFYEKAGAVLSCSVATSCGAGTVIYRMSNTSNAHGEVAGGSNYTQLVCCSGIVSLGNSCSGNFATAIKLSATTNAQAQQGDQSGYANSACISAPAGNTITVAFQANNCTNYDTALGSISAVTNAHLGTSTVYTTRICAKITLPQSITFSISANTVGFGNLQSGSARFATSDSLGNSSEVEAHNIQVSSNASSGYVLTVRGGTLSSGALNINAIGGTNTASSPGTEQFGLRMTATGGSGAVTSPYSASGFAYAASSTTSSQVASASTGDGVNTVYSVRYIGNIRGDTEYASYNSNLTYVVTANF